MKRSLALIGVTLLFSLLLLMIGCSEGDNALQSTIDDQETAAIENDSMPTELGISAQAINISSVRLTMSPASPVPVGMPVKLIGSATTNPNLQMKFQYCYLVGTTTWVDINEFSKDFTTIWTPKVAGSYQIRLALREGDAGRIYYSSSTICQVRAALSSVVIPQAPKSITVNRTVTLNARSTNGVRVSFAFREKVNGDWKMLRAYTRSVSYRWTPTEVGQHIIQVWAREEGSEREYDVASPEITVQVTPEPAPTVTLTVTPAQIKPGQRVLLRWTSTNATSVTAANFTTGGKLSGSIYASPYDPIIYSITVTGPGGEATATASVTYENILIILPHTPLSLSPGQTQQFSASIGTTPTDHVIWRIVEANAGMITPDGMYIAPQRTGTFHITATSTDDATLRATATVVVQASLGTVTVQ